MFCVCLTTFVGFAKFHFCHDVKLAAPQTESADLILTHT